jgi:isopropylmalate/homocitrate/citramalate synthase
VRYCDTTGGDSPGRIRERFAKLASAVGIPVETHCHNDLGMAVANSVSGALGDLDAGQDRGNYELYDDSVLGPFPSDWHTRAGRVVLTGEYGGKAGFRHVLDGLDIAVAEGEEDLVFSLVQLSASATGKPLTDDELRLIAGYPHQLALLFPGLLSAG